MIYVRPDLRDLFANERSVADFLAMPTEAPMRAFANRRTARFMRGGRAFFIKAHRGIGWWEIFKNLLTLRLPVTGARSEWRAIEAIERLCIDTMKIAAYGETGMNPAARQSFLITEALENTLALDKWATRHQVWLQSPEGLRYKRALIAEVARITRKLHTQGINHRDLYLCHFLLDLHAGNPPPDPANLRLFLIDLHRVQVRRRAPTRWVVKDVAGLLYYVLYLTPGLVCTRQDLIRFIRAYTGQSLREALQDRRRFWRRVVRRIVKTYLRDNGVPPRLPVFLQAAL